MSVLFFLSIVPVLFLFVKLPFVGIRLSDTNVYFYTAYLMTLGKALYKNIFFTNFPFFPMVSSLYLRLFQNNITWYYASAGFEVAFSGALMGYITYKKTKTILLSIFIQFIYLFSFVVLSTSDHQTGVFLASFLSVVSLYFYETEKYLLTGIFLGLMCMTKAYYAPVALGFFVYFMLWRRRDFLKMLIGFLLSVSLVFGPYVVSSGASAYKDIVLYSLFRAEGVDKLNVFRFFILHDPVLFILVVFSLWNYRKNRLFALISLFSVLLLVFYQDIYYLYLNLMVPFSVFVFLDFVRAMRFSKKAVAAAYLVALFFTGMSLSLYLSNYSRLQLVPDINEFVRVIKRERPDYLYGAMGITPALSYLTKIPLLGGVVDTNENLFNKGVYSAKHMTELLLHSRAALITTGADYPQYQVRDDFLDRIYNKKSAQKSCNLLASTPIQTEGLANRINIFLCSP